MNALHIVTDPGGERMSVGARQAGVLLRRGLIVLNAIEPHPPGEIHHYNLGTAQTLGALNALMIEKAELRECDFCMSNPAEWLINTRRFIIAPPMLGGGELRRPIICCEDCAGLVRDNDKAGLIERAVTLTIERAKEQNAAMAAHVTALGDRARTTITPPIREFVMAVFAQRDGYPECRATSEP